MNVTTWLGNTTKASVLSRLHRVSIDEWSSEREAQVLALIASLICQVHCHSYEKQCHIEFNNLVHDLTSLFYIMHRASDIIVEGERSAGSSTPGATWKYMIVAVYWLLSEFDKD